MKKGFLLGLTLGLVLASLSIVFASMQIQATLNDQIKVTLDGKIQEFKDEKTNETQYPITYNNRTYLPLRTVANLVGVDVDYDAETKTAKLITKGEEKKSGDVPKEEQKGTAGSNIPLKDNVKEAKYQIEVAMQYLLEKAYGDKVVDARFKDIKIYSAEDEKEIESLVKLTIDDIAFEIHYELRPAEGVDPRELTAGTGDYDEESGWVIEKYNLGILRPNPDKTSEQKYIITDFGTGW